MHRRAAMLLLWVGFFVLVAALIAAALGIVGLFDVLSGMGH